MATKQVKGEWKVTNRGRRSWRYCLRMKERKGGAWYMASVGYGPKEDLHLYHYVSETITKVVMRHKAVTLEDAPEEVRNEIVLWKMSQK